MMLLMRNPTFLLVMLCLATIQYSTAQRPMASFDRTVSPLVVMESDGTAEVCVNLDRAVTQPTSVRVHAGVGVLATAGEDFVPLDETITFTSTETRKCVNVTILDDNIEEGEVAEFITVQLLAAEEPGGDVSVESSLYQISIVDTDRLLIGFTQPIYEIAEAGSQAVCVRIINGTLNSGVSLRVRITAELIGELTFNTTSILVSPDINIQNCAGVSITDDNVIEGVENFELTISEEDLEVRFEDDTAMLMVRDNDGAMLELVSAELQLLEKDLGEVSNGSLCVRLTDDLGGLRRDIILNVTSLSDNATSGVDFEPVSASLTVPSNAVRDSIHCIEFKVLGDDQREPNETFSLILHPITADIIEGGVEATVIVIIEDDNDVNDCRTLDGISKGELMQQGNSFDSIASYTCYENHVLVPEESRVRVCSREMNKWNGTDPECIARCSRVSIEMGQIQGDVNNAYAGTEITYSCNPNYQLNGNLKRQCMDTGVWTGMDPVCEARRCNRLGNPDDGGVSIDGSRRVGSVATYSCVVGYTLMGDRTRDCTGNFTWSGEEPICAGATGVVNVGKAVTGFSVLLLSLLALLSL